MPALRPRRCGLASKKTSSPDFGIEWPGTNIFQVHWHWVWCGCVGANVCVVIECSRGFTCLNLQHSRPSATMRYHYQAESDLQITPIEKIRLQIGRASCRERV